MTISYLMKMAESSQDHFPILWEKERKFSKPLENTVGKGEITRYEQLYC